MANFPMAFRGLRKERLRSYISPITPNPRSYTVLSDFLKALFGRALSYLHAAGVAVVVAVVDALKGIHVLADPTQAPFDFAVQTAIVFVIVKVIGALIKLVPQPQP